MSPEEVDSNINDQENIEDDNMNGGRRSRRAGRKSRKGGRKSRGGSRKSRGGRTRRAGRKSRRAGRKSRRAGRKSRRGGSRGTYKGGASCNIGGRKHGRYALPHKSVSHGFEHKHRPNLFRHHKVGGSKTSKGGKRKSCPKYCRRKTVRCKTYRGVKKVGKKHRRSRK